MVLTKLPAGIRPLLRRFGIPFVIILIASSTYLARGFEFLELELIDARLQFMDRVPESAATLVAVDPESLAELGPWPWPRDWHADVIETLYALGARGVVVDIDLSGKTTSSADRALEETLARHRETTVLAAFAQRRQIAAPDTPLILTQPKDSYQRFSQLAAVALRPDMDGAVRRLPVLESFGNTIIPSLSATLARDARNLPQTFYVDYSIDPGALTILSYADVRSGRVDEALVRDRDIMLGVTASQLGTHIPVPRYRALPASVVHILGAESLLSGRALVRPSMPFTIAITALLTLALWYSSRRLKTLRRATLLIGATIAGIFAVSFVAYAVSPVLLDITPWVLAALMVLVAVTAEMIRNQQRHLTSMALAQRKSNRFMWLVFNSLEEAVITTDLAGRILSVNKAASRIFSGSRSSLRGLDIAELLPPGVRTPTQGRQMLETLVRSETNQRRMAQGLNGPAFPVDISGRRMEDGEQNRFVLTVHDMSRYEEIERERENVKQQLLDAMESFGEAFAMYDPGDRLVMSNSEFRSLFSGRPDAVRPGATFDHILGVAIDTGIFKLSKQARQSWSRERIGLRDGSVPKLTRTVQLTDGRWLQVVDQRIGGGGFVSILFDVSAAKAREREIGEAKQAADLANHAKSEFLANMSHELRTPLNAVIGFSEMITREIRGPINNPAYLDYGRAIHQSARHLLEIIQDILDLSKIEAGSIVLNEADIQLDDLLESVCELLTPHATEIELELVLKRDPNLPMLRGDPRLVKQIFTNLLANAVKFSSPGERVVLEAHLNREAEIEISVKDTGIGIAPEHLELIMQPFGQIENAMTRSHEGVGLGLPLARMFCQAHEAGITIDSAPGKGTTVTVRFPAQRTVKGQISQFS